VKRGLKTGVHASGDGIVGEDSGLCLAVSADVVGEIAAGTQNEFDGSAEAGCGEYFGDDVVPGGSCAGEDCGRAMETAIGEEGTNDVDCALKKARMEGSSSRTPS